MLSPAHPRSRGENRRHYRPAVWDRGSSPLTRGKRPGRAHGPLRRRLIPAHAGKTPARAGASRRSGAHPRSRGENLVRIATSPVLVGSSPLTRGKRFMMSAVWVVIGLIPAHAGKTRTSAITCRPSRAHPRSRGENLRRPFLCDGRVGSSPLTRGKLTLDFVARGQRGLIPAHAGKTWWTPTGWEPSRAHPRSRGENPHCTLRSPLVGGSSPLTRGKRAVCPQVRNRRRLIPAHAGKTV